METQTPRRRRSPSHDARSRAPYSSRDELDIAEEADYYNSRAAERSYLGEGYHGANRDWAIVDVPPGTKRVEMEGIGGAKEEITWQRYNGVRRSKFIAESDEEYRGPIGGGAGGELMAPREREELSYQQGGRRYVGEKDPKEKMWTEITKDLVTEDAIKQMGYDFEETEFFYYIMSYLRYVSHCLFPLLSFMSSSSLVCPTPRSWARLIPDSYMDEQEDVLRLVDLSEDLKRDRRERIREIEWEQRQPLPPPLPREKPRLAIQGGRPWEEERIVEREVIYEGPPPPSRRYR